MSHEPRPGTDAGMIAFVVSDMTTPRCAGAVTKALKSQDHRAVGRVLTNRRLACSTLQPTGTGHRHHIAVGKCTRGYAP